MKSLIISDIHGASRPLEIVLSYCDTIHPDQILFVGDFLNPGPRNPITPSYDPIRVSELINALELPCYGVRGNCDSEVDQMLLNLPIMSDYHIFFSDAGSLLLTHGHLSKENLPQSTDVVLSGHTHIPLIHKKEHQLLLNPGSISLPKENHPATFAVLEDRQFTIYTVESFTHYMSTES